MKILYLGDYIKKNGPSNVDINIKINIRNTNIRYHQADHMPSMKVFLYFLKATNLHVSGVSFYGAIFSVLGRLFKKKITYTMHGYLKAEQKVNGGKKHRVLIEKILFLCSHTIVVVSPQMKKLTGYSYKMHVIPNGVDFFEEVVIDKENNLITLIGGGRSEKRNLDVCKVVEELNEEGEKISIDLFGEKGRDSDEISKFYFVNDYGFVDKKQIITSLKKSRLFVQYSIWDSFSLSIADALNCKCNIIVSENVGTNFYIEENSSYVIVNSREELKNEILKIINLKRDFVMPNNSLISWSKVAKEYIKLWSE